VQLRIFSVEDQHPADVLHRLCSGARANLRQDLFARRALRAGNPDLDQLMALQGAVDFLEHAAGQACVANRDDGMQPMRSRPQVSSLLGGHGGNERRCR
jgi:hypothetical protein